MIKTYHNEALYYEGPIPVLSLDRPLSVIGRSLAPHSPRPANAHYYNKRALAALRRQLASLLPLMA